MSGSDGTAPAAGTWRIPRPVLVVAARTMLLLVLPLVAGYALSGLSATVGMAMGYLATLPAALAVPWRFAAGLALPGAMTGAVAVALQGQALPAACFVALACLLVAPANLVRNGLLAGIPTIAAVLTALTMPMEPAAVAGWMLLGSAVALAVVAPLRTPSEPAGVPMRTALLHAATMAVAVGIATFLVVAGEVPHGYWITMTMTIVLRPYGPETTNVARQRVGGTIGGAAVAVVLSILAPGAVALAVAALMLLPMAAYAVLGRYSQQVVFVTPFVILIGSGDADSAAVGVALARVLATLLGATLAAGLALALARADEAAPAVVRPGPSEPS